EHEQCPGCARRSELHGELHTELCARPRLLGAGFRRLPLALATVGASNIAAVGAVVDQFAPKPVTSLSLTSATVTPRKATALVILSDELARAAGSLVDTLIGQELRTACVRAIDSKFLSIATSAAPAANSSATTLAGFFGDLQFLLNSVGVDDAS